MKIRRIEIIGFKSFVDKTVLELEDGITAIVGPNGCGKSNVVDALRWVMGEQSARKLRGQAMEDIIFGGSELRRAHGMAEVTLTFSNASASISSALNSYSEIMVTRRLYRNGDSEYLLNKTPCRLKDIAELFMDTGVGARAYSIIEQGKIGTILQARPEERRGLIEEVAGITKYKVRKLAALRKIESAQQNLVRLNDVISEVQQQLNGLRKQAGRAQRFRDLRAKIKHLELGLARGRWQQVEINVVQQENVLRQSEIDIDGNCIEVTQLEVQLEQLRLQHREADDEAVQVQQQLQQWRGESQQVDNELALLAQQADSLLEQIATINVDLESLHDSDDQHDAVVAGLHDQGGVLAQQFEELSQECVTVQDNIATLSELESVKAAQLEQVREELLRCQGNLVCQRGQQETATTKLELLQQRQQRYLGEFAEATQQQQQCIGQLSQCRQQLAAACEVDAALVVAGHRIQQRHQQLQQDLSKLQQDLDIVQQRCHRCESLRASLQELDSGREGCTAGVREILAHTQLAQLFDGVLADHVTVVDGHAAAVAAAVGDSLQGLYLQDITSIAEVDQLLSDELSYVSQLPVGDCPAIIYGDLVLGGTPLVDLLEVDSCAQPFVQAVTQGCFLVADLTPFLAMALPHGLVLVNGAGDRLDWRGSYIRRAGGQTKQLLQNKRRLVQLQEQSDALKNELHAVVEKVADLSGAEQLARENLQKHQLQHQHQCASIAELRREQQRLAGDLKRYDGRVELLSAEIDKFTVEEKTLIDQSHLVEIEVQHLAVLAADLRTEVESLENDWRCQHDQLRVEHKALTQVHIKIAEVKERQNSVENDLLREQKLHQQQCQRGKQLDDRLKKISQQQSDIQQRRQQQELRQGVLLEHCQRQQQLLCQQRDSVNDVLSQVDECGRLLKSKRAILQEQRSELARVQMQLQENCLSRDHLRQSVLERYQIDLSVSDVKLDDATFDEVDEDNYVVPVDAAVAIENKLQQLQKKIDAFGEVNLLAIEEFAALEQRFEFLTGQRQDLQQSVSDLQAAINQINRTSRRRFKEAFEQVNEKFQQVFPRLFVGGNAQLLLTDDSDLLECGIDIVAQPPGKKLQNVGLLSGGEKALTSVALIFAIFLIKPSPFCILDEVDAPLDDANIARFNEMVQEMSSVSQFVIITHNTRTMEIADTLFGVTMEDPGVSALVAVRIETIAAIRG